MLSLERSGATRVSRGLGGVYGNEKAFGGLASFLMSPLFVETKTKIKASWCFRSMWVCLTLTFLFFILINLAFEEIICEIRNSEKCIYVDYSVTNISLNKKK